MNPRHSRPTMTIDPPEVLDGRLVLSAMLPRPVAVPAQVAHASAAVYTPDGTNMDKAGQTLNIIHKEYAAYEQGGSRGTFVSSQSGKVKIANGYVGVDIRVSGNVNTAAGQMKGLGMLVTGIDAATGTIEGSMPIGKIPAAADDAHVIGLSPITMPIRRGFGPR